MKLTASKFVIFSFLCASPLFARSLLRPQDPHTPTLIAAWEKDDKAYELKSSYLEPYPLFTIRTDNLIEDLLPRDEIKFRDSSGSAQGQDLSYLIEDLLQEIKKGNKKFSHFTVLQSKNYSFRQQCGLLVLKFNDYPFVLKLFIETPRTFIDPHMKGFEPIFFFYMGGGVGRHVAGLTRIKNLKNMKTMTASHPYWNDHIVFPRKWLWLPNDAGWITISGTHLVPNETLTNKIPGTYGVIADYIDTETNYKMKPREEQKMVMNYCNDMGLAVDPHRKNYSFQKHPTKDEAVMVIVDTEHFPTMVGLKDPKEFKNHTDWYRFLVNKGVNDMFMQSKKDRKDALKREHKLALVELS